MGTEANSEGCITHGPWGGSEGNAWSWMPKGMIKKITINHKEAIDCIKFLSDDCMGGTDESSLFGLFCHNKRANDTICIDYPNEYLTSISGTIGTYNASIIVNSLCFGTNKKSYGPYGRGTGTCFSYDGKGGVIVGFHGRAGSYLDAIGIYVMPESLAFARNHTSEGNSKHELCSSCMSRMVMPRGAGPWGACAGKEWDDGVFSNVKQVHVLMEESLKVLYAIQFVYVKRDATFCLSSVHGGTCGDKMKLVNLDGADEYLTGISGFYGPVKGYDGLKAIKSITFHTNKTKHGPYGKESGAGYTYFTSITASPGKVVGFHGWKLNGLLTAIGVHMEYL